MNTFVQAKIKDGFELRVLLRFDGDVQASIGFDHAIGRNVDSAIARLDEHLERQAAATAPRYVSYGQAVASDRLRAALQIYANAHAGQLPASIDVSEDFGHQLGLLKQGRYCDVPIQVAGEANWRFHNG